MQSLGNSINETMLKETVPVLPRYFLKNCKISRAVCHDKEFNIVVFCLLTQNFFNLIALRKARIVYFGLSECNRVKYRINPSIWNLKIAET